MNAHIPNLQAFREAARRGNLVPVYREVVADGDTPVSAYAKLRGADGVEPSFLLESVVGGEKWAAYSFIGVGAHAIVTISNGRYRLEWPPGELADEGVATDANMVLQKVMTRFRPAIPSGTPSSFPRFWGGAVGYLAYDAVRAFEKIPGDARQELTVPDAQFMITDGLVIFDNLRQTVKVVANAYISDGQSPDVAYAAACDRVDRTLALLENSAAKMRPLDPSAQVPVEVKHHTSRTEFLSGVERIKEYIRAGDAFQVVLSQRFSIPRDLSPDPFDVYRALRVVNPSPYMFHLCLPGATVTGASPEVLVRVEEGRVCVRPIAGTRPRGHSVEEDLRMERELSTDEKERAEHVMLIDLGRNDVGRVAAIGTVAVEEKMVVERYSHVMHLTSSVVADLAPEKSALDALRACFPAGTLTGAPKIRAMEIIEALEPSRRGIYGGAVGYLSFTGNLDMAIAIRTVVTTPDGMFVQAGAGIVADSVPEAEYQETLSKAQAVMRALQIAQSPGRA